MANINFRLGDNSTVQLNSNASYDFSNILYTSFYARMFDEFNLNCKYFSELSAANALNNIKTPFVSCVGINIQSLNSKFNELLNFINNNRLKGIFLDLLCLSETWTNDFTRFHIPNYNIYYASRTVNSRGGVAIYINSKFTSSQINHPSLFIDSILEAVCIKFSVKGGIKCLAISLYRPNSHPILSYNDQSTAFLEQFLILLNFLYSFDLPVILMGDYNLNLFLTIK